MRWCLDGILLCYLMVASIQDIRKKTVSVRLAVLFMGLAIVLRLVCFKESDLTWLAGILPGICLFGVAGVTRQSIGYGDALVMLVIGFYQGWNGFGMLMLALLIQCPVSLAVFLWKRNRKLTLPFVPFLLAACVLKILIL